MLILFPILLGATTLLVGVRIYTRCRITHGFGSDDVLILLAFVRTPVLGLYLTGNIC